MLERFFVFHDFGLTFSTVEDNGQTLTPAAEDLPCPPLNNDGTYYFLVNVEASLRLSKYNIQSGTQLSATSYLYGSCPPRPTRRSRGR